MIQSFDWRTLQWVQEHSPGISTVYLTVATDFENNIEAGKPVATWTAGKDIRDYGGSVPRLVKASGGAVWSPFHGNLSREALREAQALNLKIIVWTVNEPADMRRLIAWGVDGIITDRPDILRDVARAMALPVFGGMLVEPFTSFIVPTLYCSYMELKKRAGFADEIWDAEEESSQSEERLAA